MRNLFWNRFCHSRVCSNPMLLGIAVALVELYEPLMHEALPERWTALMDTFDGRVTER